MNINLIFNPLGLRSPPNSLVDLQCRLMAQGLGMVAEACRIYANPEQRLPAPWGAAVKQGISIQNIWISGIHGLTYDTMKHGLGLDRAEEPQKIQAKLDI